MPASRFVRSYSFPTEPLLKNFLEQNLCSISSEPVKKKVIELAVETFAFNKKSAVEIDLEVIRIIKQVKQAETDTENDPMSPLSLEKLLRRKIVYGANVFLS